MSYDYCILLLQFEVSSSSSPHFVSLRLQLYCQLWLHITSMLLGSKIINSLFISSLFLCVYDSSRILGFSFYMFYYVHFFKLLDPGTSFFIPFHQYTSHKSLYILVDPRWMEYLELCPSSSIFSLSPFASSTHNQPWCHNIPSPSCEKTSNILSTTNFINSMQDPCLVLL